MDIPDLTGQRFGRLVVMGRAPNDKSGGARWHCHCDCRTDTISRGVQLRGGVKDCGCATREMLRARAIRRMIGKRFGKLTVVEFDKKLSDNSLSFVCLCECGERISIANHTLCRGARTHCGCLSANPATFDNIPNKYKVSNQDVLIGRQLIVYKSHAKKNHRMFDLLFGLFKSLILGNCHYCGTPPARTAKRNSGGASELLVSGIDRIDNALGYVDGNVVSCCETCNLMKLDHPLSGFLEHAQKISSFQNRAIEPISLGC